MIYKVITNKVSRRNPIKCIRASPILNCPTMTRISSASYSVTFLTDNSLIASLILCLTDQNVTDCARYPLSPLRPPSPLRSTQHHRALILRARSQTEFYIVVLLSHISKIQREMKTSIRNFNDKSVSRFTLPYPRSYRHIFSFPFFLSFPFCVFF